jgi:hypothetical protein
MIVSFLIWVLLVLEFGLALRFLGLHLSLPEVIVLMTAARLAFLLPIPAGIGGGERANVGDGSDWRQPCHWDQPESVDPGARCSARWPWIMVGRAVDPLMRLFQKE